MKNIKIVIEIQKYINLNFICIKFDYSFFLKSFLSFYNFFIFFNLYRLRRFLISTF
jgi:hypothetical protein